MRLETSVIFGESPRPRGGQQLATASGAPPPANHRSAARRTTVASGNYHALRRRSNHPAAPASPAAPHLPVGAAPSKPKEGDRERESSRGGRSNRTFLLQIYSTRSLEGYNYIAWPPYKPPSTEQWTHCEVLISCNKSLNIRNYLY